MRPNNLLGCLTHHAFMKHPHTKRDYLLPKGCKDLADVLKPKAKQQQEPTVTTIQLPPIIGELTLPDQMTFGELAAALKQKPSKIIADSKQFGISPWINDYTAVEQMIPFEFVSDVIRLYGFTAKKAA